MADTQMVIMPKTDYVGACDVIRQKTGKVAVLKSGELADEINAIPFIRTSSASQAPEITETEHPVVTNDTVATCLLQPPVTYACFATTGNTTLTGTLDVEAGDWVLCTITTRSTTTLPSGWTVLHESTVLNANNGIQRMAMVCKQSTEAETVSVTVTQAASACICLTLIAVSGIEGFAYHEGTEYYTNDSLYEFTVDRPDYTTLIWACSAYAWTTVSSQYGWWKCDEVSMMPISMTSSTQRRQANFWDAETGDTRTFRPCTTSTAAIIDCVEVLTA